MPVNGISCGVPGSDKLVVAWLIILILFQLNRCCSLSVWVEMFPDEFNRIGGNFAIRPKTLFEYCDSMRLMRIS